MKHQKWAGCLKQIDERLTAADWLIIGWAIGFFTVCGLLILKG